MLEISTEIWSDASDSFTKRLWNCDNVLLGVDPCDLNKTQLQNVRSLEYFALKVGGCGVVEGGFCNFQRREGGYPKWGWGVLTPLRTMILKRWRYNK